MKSLISFFRKKSLLKEVEKTKTWLTSFTDETVSVKENTFSEVLHIKNVNNLSWESTFKHKEVRKLLYQLMLHRQFIGQLAENLRQKTFELFKLEGKAPLPFDKGKYAEVIEYGVASDDMTKLFSLFIEEIEPIIKRYDQDIS